MNEIILNRKVRVERCIILIHEYKKLDIRIMVDVIGHRMRDPLHFANAALKVAG